jgi:hypothetical protein
MAVLNNWISSGSFGVAADEEGAADEDVSVVEDSNYGQNLVN